MHSIFTVGGASALVAMGDTAKNPTAKPLRRLQGWRRRRPETPTVGQAVRAHAKMAENETTADLGRPGSGARIGGTKGPLGAPRSEDKR
jgi:hypothetical protein